MRRSGPSSIEVEPSPQSQNQLVIAHAGEVVVSTTDMTTGACPLCGDVEYVNPALGIVHAVVVEVVAVLVDVVAVPVDVVVVEVVVVDVRRRRDRRRGRRGGERLALHRRRIA